jgi:hypothetical protein
MTDRSCLVALQAGQSAIIRHISWHNSGYFMSALANHAFAKMNGIGNEIVVYITIN